MSKCSPSVVLPVYWMLLSASSCLLICKLDVPKSNIAIIWTPMFERYLVRCGSKQTHTKKKHVVKIDWSTCSKYANHFILNSQHDWEDLLNEHEHLHFDNE